MSYEHNHYSGSDPEHEDRAEDYDDRLAAFDAGLCSRRAAIAGGAEYLRDLAETMLELKEAGCAIPKPVAGAPATFTGRKPAPREEGKAA
jgi:hypothetical protein